MKIGIMGYGFVGGTTGKVLSTVHEIFPYDKYKKPYCEKKCLRELAENSELCFICVPTPMKRSGEMDYSAVRGSIDSLLEETREVGRDPKDILVTIRSTAVSGTTDALAERYPFKFAFNPEFLREKHALEDMRTTNRVVIGANDAESAEKLMAVYKPLFPEAAYIIVDIKTAEMIKYAANVQLTMQIAAANELFGICRATGVDFNSVKDAILRDSRIGRPIDVPGPDGDFRFGGKCFPKDLNALIHLAREHGYRPNLLEAAWDLNLKVRRKRDWEEIPGATSENKNFSRE